MMMRWKSIAARSKEIYKKGNAALARRQPLLKP
jgi:hypothetical protein